MVSEDVQEIHVAISGDPHGQHDSVYDAVREYERHNGVKIDLLICCGDYEAWRNAGDLKHVHAPVKHRHLLDFPKYYSGEKEAPCLTLFVGGNHENTAFNMELPHGGWAAPNIYYMGFASVLNFGGLRIAGWSGIFREETFLKTHFECPPFSNGKEISAYHVRAIEKFRLELLADEKKANCIDIFVSHDWPAGVTKHGDEKKLFQKLVHQFQRSLKTGYIGNPAASHLLTTLRPRYWFGGHMHCKFEATMEHKQKETKTEFLVLDKCSPGEDRPFFEVKCIKVPGNLSKELRYDPQWLAILRKTAKLEVATRGLARIPCIPDDFCPTDEDIKQVEELFDGTLKVPHNFKLTAPPEDAYKPDPNYRGAYYYRNPQTAEFCAKLQIPDLNEQLCVDCKKMAVPYYLLSKEG